METSAATRPIPRPASRARSGVLLRLASDERLVEHVRAGSEPAFEVLYDRHHRGILGFCRHMLGSVEEAEDALQHTFMAAYRDLVGSEKAIQLRPWLYTIARNRCYTVLRARRERPMGEADEPTTENLSAAVQRRQDLRDVLSDLSGLPDDQRAALVLAELGAVSHEDIATVLDVPRDKVKALVFQARSSLIASRNARETPCEEIREQLANLRGGSLRRTELHRHLRECPGCREFRTEITAQRRALALVLPVLPTAGLKHTALAAAFGTGSAGGGAAVVASTAAVGSTVAVKALVAVALIGGGTTAAVTAVHDAKPPSATRSGATSPSRAPATPPGFTRSQAAAPAAGAPHGTRAAPAAGPTGDERGAARRTDSTPASPRPGRRRAVRAHGRSGAPGQLKAKPARPVKKPRNVKAAPLAEGRRANPPAARLPAKAPARARTPATVRPAPVVPQTRPEPVKRTPLPAPVVVAPAPAPPPVLPEQAGAKKLK